MRATTAYAMIWVSVAVAACVGIVSTGSLTPLWLFLVPPLISFKGTDKN